jgi:hypothetical protein
MARKRQSKPNTDTDTPVVTTALPGGPMAYTKDAQDLFDRVSKEWKLTPPVLCMLRLACENLTKAAECDAVTAEQGMTVIDSKGTPRPHPLALLSRDLKNHAGSLLQKLTSNLQ